MEAVAVKKVVVAMAMEVVATGAVAATGEISVRRRCSTS